MLAAIAAFSGAAHAARPLSTDDAGVIAPRACELEGGRAVARADGASAGATGVALACGLGADTQLGLAYDRARAGGETARGLSLLGKTQLWSGGDGGPAVALGYAAGWARSASSGWRHEATALRLIGSHPAGPVVLHANMGHARDEAAGLRATTWGLAAESVEVPAAGLGWAPVAELFGDDRGDRWGAVGLRLTLLPERLFLDAAWARQLVAEKARVWCLGFKFAF